MLPSPDNRHQILGALCRAPCILSMQLCVLWRHKHETFLQSWVSALRHRCLEVYLMTETAIVAAPCSCLCTASRTVCIARQHSVRVCSLLTLLLYRHHGRTGGSVCGCPVGRNGWLIEQLSHNPLVGPSESALRVLGSLSTSGPGGPAPVLAPPGPPSSICSGLSLPCSFGLSPM